MVSELPNVTRKLFQWPVMDFFEKMYFLTNKIKLSSPGFASKTNNKIEVLGHQKTSNSKF